MAEFVVDETERRSFGLPSRALVAAVLVALTGERRGERVKLGERRARVGSAAESTLRLEDRSVSRVHCEVLARTDAIALRDLGSTNGTFVGGVRVRDADVPLGTTVQCGGAAFRIEAAEEVVVPTLSTKDAFGELVGRSLEMRRVYAVLERVAASGATLLVGGETGTGKDVVASSVHRASARAQGPFVPVDCGAIPETLFESELFGHVRGAFTGAVQARMGAFEEASGGTIFLDEIGEMPLALQAKMLRVLETRRVRRVGAAKELEVDVRVISATNRRLEEMVNRGTFREDLYYRLAVVEVTLPPLRDRREDIPMLANHLYRKVMNRTDTLPAGFVAKLGERAWPGNVRELRNAIERAVTLGHLVEDGAAAERPAVPAGLASTIPLHLPLKDARLMWTREFESLYAAAMLERTAGNVTRAAEHAGVSRRFLQRLVARLGLRTHEPGEPGEPGEQDEPGEPHEG